MSSPRGLSIPVPKRVSSLLVTDDLTQASTLYHDLGFARVETDDLGCVGYVAGETGVILASRAFAMRCWGNAATAALADRFVPYIFLASIDEAHAPGDVLADARTWFGTHERIVQTSAGPLVLVEMALQGNRDGLR